ncbi:MAG TPA: DUF5777 family beta-barrel protein [Longimicrobiales bacterium]|nr:DUF5777 family beta-barrel protein [Longimicrobiales bacterium]
MRLVSSVAALLIASSAAVSAQDVFHSTQSANLPTAVVLPQGSWLFEISHRFTPPVSNGAESLWGLDGPVYNRLGLSYAASDRVTLGVQRTNFQDNLELNAKVGLWSAGADAGMPLEVAAMGGVAWNTQVTEVQGAEDNEMQAYAQLVLNALLGERVAVGVVPTYLYNPRILDVGEESAVALGLMGQLYATSSISLLIEWLVSEERAGQENDAATFGVEIETRGHFFKLLLTNQVRLNPTQFLGGTPTPFEPDEWRFGFNIQRLLPF